MNSTSYEHNEIDLISQKNCMYFTSRDAVRHFVEEFTLSIKVNVLFSVTFFFFWS
jgi:hypothetical protein